MVTFAPTVAICVNVVPSVERSTLNPVSLFELSVQDRLIWLDDTAVAVRFVGGLGVGHTPEYELAVFEYRRVTVYVVCAYPEIPESRLRLLRRISSRVCRDSGDLAKGNVVAATLNLKSSFIGGIIPPRQVDLQAGWSCGSG